MKLLLCVAFIIIGVSTGLTIGSPHPPSPKCPDGLALHFYHAGQGCNCGGMPKLKPNCPSSYFLGPGCQCFLKTKSHPRNDEKSCGSVIQELTFKNSIACINCATDFCLQKKNFSLQQAMKDEVQCKATLECLRAHGNKCRCIP